MNERERLPKGWDEARVQRVLEYYESQSDEDAAAEHETAHRARDVAWMEIPVELVGEVRKLLARKRAG